MKLAVEDRLALHDLLADYSWAFDTADLDGLVACFTPDAEIVEQVFDDPDVWQGHEGIRRFGEHYRDAVNFPGRQHHVSQVQFDPQADGSVNLRAFVFVTECQAEPPFLLRFVGWYQDIATKDANGNWRFKRRTIRMWDVEISEEFPRQRGMGAEETAPRIDGQAGYWFVSTPWRTGGERRARMSSAH